MIDYQQGKIYKVQNVITGKTYYGATCDRLLCTRMCKHRSSNNLNFHKQLGNMDDCFISLVCNYPCNNKMELHKRERYYIENYECINMIIPTRTPAEYYEANKERIRLKRLKNLKEEKEEIKKILL